MKTKEEIDATFKDAPYYAYKEGLQEGFHESFNSIRTQAAIAAMQSILNNKELLHKLTTYINTGGAHGYYDYAGLKGNKDDVAKIAVAYAENLIAELKK